MNFLNKMERKFGRFAIRNLTKYIILFYVVGYVFQFLYKITGSPIYFYLLLNPADILQGQIWRLVTWLLIPPSELNIFTIIMLFFYYSLGTSLERTWGDFRYNVYILSGVVFTVIGAFLVYFITGTISIITPYYINLSIFLAFAASYPDMQVLLYFVIPVKIKWMAYLDGVYLLYAFIQGGASIRMMIIASLLNFIVFFFSTRNYSHINPKEVHRRQQFQKAVHPKMAPGVTKHKCAVCGRTEKDGDNLEFRFCSKCNGNYEYCQDHLFTHEHIK